MNKIDYGFQQEYESKDKQPESEKDIEKPEGTDTDFEKHYTVANPKRIIIRGKIHIDKSQD